MNLGFLLQIDMNQIFQMRYYGAFQTKELQIYKPSKFAKTGDGPQASLENRGHPQRISDFLGYFLTYLPTHIQFSPIRMTVLAIYLPKNWICFLDAP